VLRGAPARASRRHDDDPRAGVGALGGGDVGGVGSVMTQALNRWRRIEATLEKIRTPRTTTTPVDS
jgi:hypothetical protein